MWLLNDKFSYEIKISFKQVCFTGDKMSYSQKYILKVSVHGINIPSWTWHDVGSSHTLGIRAVLSYITSDEQFLLNRGCYFPLHVKLPGDFRFANNNTTYEKYLLNFMFTLVRTLFPDWSLNSFCWQMKKKVYYFYEDMLCQRHGSIGLILRPLIYGTFRGLSTEFIVPHFYRLPLLQYSIVRVIRFFH